jgi:exo-beta-1,3-glucanase (GH17 family)
MLGTRLFLGIFSLDNAAGQAGQIIDAVRGNWALVDTISVGNELVNGGQASPQQVVGRA